MSDEVPAIDSPSGQPYSAPRKAWGGNADPRNLSYEGARFGPGYEQPNDVPWDGNPPQSYLPPPSTEERIEQERYQREPDPQHPGYARNGLELPPADNDWLKMEPKPRSWFARHKVLTGLLAVVALFLVVGIIGAVTA